MNNNKRDFREPINIESAEIKDWKHFLEEKINCNKDDLNCWKNLMPSLPCNLGDTKCWKKNYPSVPCSGID